MHLTADLTGGFMGPVCDTTMRCIQEDHAVSEGHLSFHVVAMCHSRGTIHISIEDYSPRVAMRRTEWSTWVSMQDLSCIAMVHIRKCSYLGLLYGNASYDESILCLHGIYSITYGNALYGIYDSPKWINASYRPDPKSKRARWCSDWISAGADEQCTFIHWCVSQPPKPAPSPNSGPEIYPIPPFSTQSDYLGSQRYTVSSSLF